jgi:hypothetical protein
LVQLQAAFVASVDVGLYIVIVGAALVIVGSLLTEKKTAS